MSQLELEKQTVEKMIRLYCRRKEGNKQLCSQCKELLEYSHIRLSHCRFDAEKPTCKTCVIHCYNSEMKERMQIVMRYSGPLMLIYHPVAAIRHLWKEFFSK